MAFLSVVHHRLFVLLFVEQVVIGIWALVLGFKKRPVSGTLLSVIVVDEALLIVQSVVGGLLLAGGQGPKPLHFLYGGLLLALLPLVYPYANRRPQRAGVWLGITLLFMAGLIVRTHFTA